MHVSVADAKEMSLWEYQGLIHWNNVLHDKDGMAASPPDPAKVRADLASLDSRYTH